MLSSTRSLFVELKSVLVHQNEVSPKSHTRFNSRGCSQTASTLSLWTSSACRETGKSSREPCVKSFHLKLKAISNWNPKAMEIASHCNAKNCNVLTKLSATDRVPRSSREFSLRLRLLVRTNFHHMNPHHTTSFIRPPLPSSNQLLECPKF